MRSDRPTVAMAVVVLVLASVACACTGTDSKGVDVPAPATERLRPGGTIVARIGSRSAQTGSHRAGRV